MLKVSEIFKSIQGESTHAGLPCVFIRLAGCNLNCRWCDTAYARGGGKEYSIDQVLEEVKRLDCKLVEVTGGEPMLQEEAFTLVQRLIDSGYDVLVETNGTVALRPLHPTATKIIDIKCPSSGECGKFTPTNLSHLNMRDEIKFVVADRADFDWAVEFISRHGLEGKFNILISPVHGRLEPRRLAGWLLRSGLKARLNLQIQKLIDLP